jgi:hypothetical protein
MILPADVARCIVNLCTRREECARAVPPPTEWERVVYSTFPDEGCQHFIEREYERNT